MGSRVDRAKLYPRDLTHPFTHVLYEVGNHTHIYAAGGGELIEEMAQGLAEAVDICNEGRHNGHGQTHGSQAAEDAYRSAVYQLLTRDYWQEWVDIQRKIEHYEMWGGPVPALGFQPKPGDKGLWQAYIVHPETGVPTFYDIPASLLELPPPDPKKYHEGSLGYYRKGG